MESQPPSLDDIELFLAVADGGGLSAAARATGLSVPTLSRRMAELERRTGRRLFHRGPRGYALSAEGRALLNEASDLRGPAQRLRRWIAAPGTPVRVRITAGLWTSRHLARCIGSHWTPDAGWLPEFVAANHRVDIARREADIGVRNARPDQPWLAGRRTVAVRYAVYGTGERVAGYVGLADEVPTTPSDRWLRATEGARIVTTASDARLALDMALAGVGRIVMPTFAGDAEAGLARLSDPIDEITHDEWLVSHHDGRHDPPVRAALDVVHEILTSPGRGG
ncbi:LysR family transcriptional regulator [Mesobaculum littorinae]|uniref:LysR family transcriptional regulator n=1 Tax=Mesobaculum littorinae TaxID=2486419 RepID=A0A438ALG2_9RHOB|nr:LysR family transcriptional regulator [Mesobaculum littorinae]RVV99376.1 LysR family transcriptional regulator [Mesobaculum littorinae]